MNEIRVTYYTSATDKQVAKVRVFQDDTISVLYAKVAAALGRTDAPYLWSKNKPLGWRIKSSDWDGYDANPFVAKGTPGSAPVLVFDENTALVDTLSTVKATFRDHVKGSKSFLAHYFPDIALPSFQKDDALLNRIWTHQSLIEPVYAIAAITYRAKLNIAGLEQAMQAINARRDIVMFQWVQDSAHVMYKLFKEHAVPSDILSSWLAGVAGERGEIKSRITGYSRFLRRDSFAKIVITDAGEITVAYVIDPRETVQEDEIRRHLAQIGRYFESVFKQRLRFAETNVNIRTELLTKDRPNLISELGRTISRLRSLFHVAQQKSTTLTMLYKRCSNYKRVSIHDYIISRIRLNISEEEILEDLAEHGESANDAAEYLQQAKDQLLAGEEPKRPGAKHELDTGVMIRLTTKGQGYGVLLTNAVSLREMQRAMVWLLKTIQHVTTITAKPAPPPKKPQRPKTPSSSSSSSSSTKNLLHGDDDDLDFLGGGLGRGNEGFFLKPLQAADPELFIDAAGYAAKCGATPFRQPIVVSQEEKAAMDAEGYSNSYDSAMTYGSRGRSNVYMCPRIWCPQSRRPLTPKQMQEKGCPGGEEPMLLYEHNQWNNSPDTPHHISFHRDCLPCCGIRKPSAALQKKCVIPAASEPGSAPKKQPTPKEASTPSSKKDETNLLKHRAPLAENRYGAIPKVIHDTLVQNVAYPLCATSLSTQECLVRKGVAHGGDSFFAAVADTLGGITKKQFIAACRERISPLDYMCLENGGVLAAFLDAGAAAPAIVKKWYADHPKHSKLLRSNPGRDAQIAHSFERFLAYIATDTPKNPYYFFDLLKQAYGVVLMLWERQQKEGAILRCPYYMSQEDLLRDQSDPKAIMLLRDGDYYEPLNFKQINRPGQSIIPYGRVAGAAPLYRSCGHTPLWRFAETIGKLRTLARWTEAFLLSQRPFHITAVILSPDLRITHFQLRCGALLATDPLHVGLVKDLLLVLPHIEHVIHHDDISGQAFDIEVLRYDADIFRNKAAALGMYFDMGTMQTGPAKAYVTRLVVPPAAANVVPTIVLPDSTHVAATAREQHKSKKWRELQKAVGSVLLESYDTLVVPLLEYMRPVRVRTLMNTFPRIPDRLRLQAILEEIPMEPREALEDWVRRIGHDDAFPWLSTQVHESARGDQWIFSQAAVELGNISRIFGENISHQFASEIEGVPATEEEPSLPLPSALSPKAPNKLESLPAKWTDIRSYKWSDYRVIRAAEYTRAIVPDIISWIAGQLRIQLNLAEVRALVNRKVAPMLKDEPNMNQLIGDPAFRTAWLRALGKSTKMIKSQVWKKVFEPEDRRILETKWTGIVQEDALWPFDITWLCAAELLDISVLILMERGPYRGLKDVKRGHESDLVASSLFFAPKYNEAYVMERPLVIIRKLVQDEFSEYSAVLDSRGTFLHGAMRFCDADAMSLVRAHLKNKSHLD
jgi:hypothetical protein